jgi:hypothetical protein
MRFAKKEKNIFIIIYQLEVVFSNHQSGLYERSKSETLFIVKVANCSTCYLFYGRDTVMKRCSSFSPQRYFSFIGEIGTLYGHTAALK